ncbi:MAG: hypothetical protein V3U65_13870 [Granulosicoccaceae bacterium]
MHLLSSLCFSICLLLPGLLLAQTIEIQIEDNNVSGGGFQSDVTISDNGQTVYSSADVSGIFKSTDGGLRFENINEGLMSHKVASVAMTPDNNQIVYAGTGDKGASSGLFRSIDGGETWALTGDGGKAQFAGNHSAVGDPVPEGHPRSNGDLIVIAQGNNAAVHTDDTIIAGTYKTGVRLFTHGGDKEVSAVNTSGFVRSLARNPSLPNIVYAAIQFVDSSKNGIYKIEYTNTSAPTSSLEYSALRPEGLAVLSNGHVYGAIGAAGLVKYDGQSWQLINSGLSVNNSYRQWTTVAGYVAGNSDVVYAGTTNLGGRLKGKNYSNVWRTKNAGDSWSPLVDAKTNVSDKIHGQPHNWWFRSHAFTQAGLGRTNSVVSSIAVSRGSRKDRVSDDIIYVSGRGGLWKSSNGGRLWQPAVSNMQATANNGVAVNPNDPNQVVLANTDYVVLATNTGFERSNLSRDKPFGAESKGYDVIFDANSNELILGVGDRDTNNPGGGNVYIKSTNKLGDQSALKWTNTNLSSVTASNNGRVRAVSYGYHDGAVETSQTILAAVEGEGVFRFHNGIWSKSTGVKIGSTKRSNFVWPDSAHSGVVYLIDLSTGLYRSNDGGQNWINIWPTMNFRNNDFYNTGYITADDKNPSTLYLSIQGGRRSPIGASFRVYRLTSADTAIITKPDSANITDITKHSGNASIKRPGPLAISPDGSLWLTQQQDSKKSISAALYVMENPATDTSFVELTTNEYRNVATSPSGIDVSSDGHIYISQNGIGIVKITVP